MEYFAIIQMTCLKTMEHNGQNNHVIMVNFFVSESANVCNYGSCGQN